MAVRKAARLFGWLSVHEEYYGPGGGGVTGTPTSDGAGSCTFDFGVDKISTGNWKNTPASTGMAYTLLGIHNLQVVNDASWADGTDRTLFNIGGVNGYARKSGSNWQLYVTDSEGTPNTQLGATLFAFSTQYDLSLRRQHATPYTIRIWMGTTEEITLASGSAGATSINFTLSASVGSTGGQMIVQEVFVVYTDTDERMDASTLNAVNMAVTSGTPMHNEYTHDEAGTPITGDKYTHVDEDGPDDDTSFLQNPATANSTFRQTYLTVNQTLANLEAGAVFERGRGTIAGKNLEMFLISGDGTNKEEVSIRSGFVGTAYGTYAAIFYRAPDAGVWSQTDLDPWEIGVRWTIGADAITWRETAIRAEAMGVDYISLAADRRRLLAQMI